MEKISDSSLERDYKLIADQSKYLLKERVLLRFLQKWNSIVDQFNACNADFIVKITLLIDKKNGDCFLKVTKNGNEKRYELNSKSIKTFEKDNSEWIDDATVFTDSNIDDFDKLVDELKYVDKLQPTDTVLIIGDPTIGVEDF